MFCFPPGYMVEQEIRELIQKDGRITFARFMQSCLYSPNGGFYSARDNKTSFHFGTSSTSHPVFGALIARQLEQMWRILGTPPVFHVIEAGSGDGALAQSIVDACRRTAPRFAQAALLRRRRLRAWTAPITRPYPWLAQGGRRFATPGRAGRGLRNPTGLKPRESGHSGTLLAVSCATS